MTGAGAVLAAVSLNGTTSVPLSVTPPFATPPSTVRVSVTEIRCPSEVRSWLWMFTSETPLAGSTTAASRPAAPGMVTMTLSPWRVTVEPGM